jgi:4'-phosphopantetheinyl transferase
LPVLNLFISPNIYIWSITESESVLKKQVNLSDKEYELIFSFSRQQRRKEMLATRSLLGTIIPNDHIHYKNRAPFLVNSSKEISISNSKSIVAIQLNESGLNTGIDIQYFSDTVLRVKYKFLHKNEYSLIEHEQESKILNIIWSAKETLYKAFSEDKLEFKKHLVIKAIKNNLVTGIIDREGVEVTFVLGLYLNKEFVLTWFIS